MTSRVPGRLLRLLHVSWVWACAWVRSAHWGRRLSPASSDSICRYERGRTSVEISREWLGCWVSHRTRSKGGWLSWGLPCRCLRNLLRHWLAVSEGIASLCLLKGRVSARRLVLLSLGREERVHRMCLWLECGGLRRVRRDKWSVWFGYKSWGRGHAVRKHRTWNGLLVTLLMVLGFTGWHLVWLLPVLLRLLVPHVGPIASTASVVLLLRPVIILSLLSVNVLLVVVILHKARLIVVTIVLIGVLVIRIPPGSPLLPIVLISVVIWLLRSLIPVTLLFLPSTLLRLVVELLLVLVLIVPLLHRGACGCNHFSLLNSPWWPKIARSEA